ncbi:gustatory receptor for sugar taste 43a-like [Galleria mellonella]|uniref:Gustatory receptor for sugar taste 43a-like n=1 Tax=Galleria mellonella TaxID=7137 RepID=A0A6J1X8I2_GALME|nr:gustatory receptor for sugar taste 43a-like [Galleria mellonella]
MLLWCIVHFISLILLVEPCHWTQEEVNRTHILVSLLTDRASAADNLLNAELNQFYKHLTLNKVAFSPLGMFTMGRPLCATIVGILSTYLVIIFQFQTAADRVDGF